MYCPECGNDAGSAKFCPECGANLAGVKDALSGKTGAAKAAKQGGGAAAATTATAATGGPKRLSPAVIWGGFGALAVVVIVVVVMVSGGFGGGLHRRRPPPTRAAPPSRPSTPTRAAATRSSSPAPTTCTTRATARSRTRTSTRAAPTSPPPPRSTRRRGRSRPTEPTVGTDYAVALFYSGDIPGALAQIDAVLKANPDFQKAWLNKGIFLSHEGRIAEQSGDKKAAQKLLAEAKTALTKAVAIDPKSDAGKQADRACSSCAVAAGCSGVRGRRAGTPAGGREPFRREGAALRNVGGTWRAGSGTAWPRRPQHYELRNGAVDGARPRARAATRRVRTSGAWRSSCCS